MYGLTRLELRTLHFIKFYIDGTGGVAPTYEEIKSAMGLKSKSNITKVLASLERKQWINRIPAKARAIEIAADLPPMHEHEPICPTCGRQHGN
jgi:repressor LexA